MKKIFDHVKNSAYEIISKKHATFYGIAMAVVRIAAIFRMIDHAGISPGPRIRSSIFSIPAVVDANGIETVVPIS